MPTAVPRVPTLLFLLTLIHACALGEDLITQSPAKSFKIVQQYHEPQAQDIGGHWSQTLHFAHGGAGVVLEHDMMWPADYHVSPDEKWLLRIQKSGSGENISYLYHIDANHRLTRIEEQIGELALAFLNRTTGVTAKDLYHTGIQFTSWNLKSGLLHFTFHGSFMNQSGKGVKQALTYKLTEHKIVPQESKRG